MVVITLVLNLRVSTSILGINILEYLFFYHKIIYSYKLYFFTFYYKKKILKYLFL